MSGSPAPNGAHRRTVSQCRGGNPSARLHRTPFRLRRCRTGASCHARPKEDRHQDPAAVLARSQDRTDAPVQQQPEVRHLSPTPEQSLQSASSPIPGSFVLDEGYYLLRDMQAILPHQSQHVANPSDPATVNGFRDGSLPSKNTGIAHPSATGRRSPTIIPTAPHRLDTQIDPATDFRYRPRCLCRARARAGRGRLPAASAGHPPRRTGRDRSVTPIGPR